ncbi:MAG TPA: DUF4340 domain-containing protein [candidate division Zixibacteria bacterium]|nr:DUF4340 domain-containing protein [candidate division Zixibacteria bacterium]HEQ98977.1 DUF4340 domain-containing protein [candidate division Zixibacteria bacterium]
MRRILLPLVILLVLIAAYLYVQNRETESIAPEKIEEYISFDMENVDSVVVEKPQDTLKFYRLDDRWRIVVDSRPRPADTTQVKQVVEMISSIDVGSLVSQNPEKQHLYRVDSLNGTLISVYGQDQELARFYLGKNASNYNYSYIRKAGSTDVYMAEDVMSYRFDKAAEDWRDKSIIQVDTATLVSIVFQYSDQEFSLERRDSLWFISGDGVSGEVKASADTVELLKRLVANLRAEDFYQPADSSFVDLENPELRLTFNHIDGTRDVLHVLGGNDSNTRYYVRLPEQEEPYVVLFAKYSGLTRKPNNFITTEKNG